MRTLWLPSLLVPLVAARAAWAAVAPPPAAIPAQVPAQPAPGTEPPPPTTTAPAPAPASGYPPPPPPASGYPPPPASGYPPPPPPAGYPPAPAGYPPAGYVPGTVMRAPGFQTHDGLYLRMHLGFGFSSFSASAGGSSQAFSGADFSFAIAIGGTVAPNLIIYGALIGDFVGDPQQKRDGLKLGSMTNTSAGIAAIGPGVAYYIQPANAFFAATLLLSSFTATDDRVRPAIVLAESDGGLGIEALFGKEWWVSDNWGLGVSAQLLAASMKSKHPLVQGGPLPTWTAVGFSLLFSATYN